VNRWCGIIGDDDDAGGGGASGSSIHPNSSLSYDTAMNAVPSWVVRFTVWQSEPAIQRLPMIVALLLHLNKSRAVFGAGSFGASTGIEY
jgi:hypothetical protein